MVDWRARLETLYWAALAAVEPEACVARALVVADASIQWLGPAGEKVQVPFPLLILGAGKAAARMARGVCKHLPAKSYRGAVVVNPGNEVWVPDIEVLEASHPLPDERSIEAADRFLALCDPVDAAGVVFLLSGGASSLLVAPRPPLTLEEKVATNRMLLESGASIDEVNTVRKHLSRIKGGGLLRRLARPVFTVAISDVVGDDPAVIGSGPTVPDPSTFEDAAQVLKKFALWGEAPQSVRHLIDRGLAGLEPETLKPHEPEAAYSHYRVVAANRDAKRAAAGQASGWGWHVEVLDAPVVGEARAAAAEFAALIQGRLRENPSSVTCVVAGGETTVTVRGKGRGGRNQEFALALAPLLDGWPVAVLSAGTDGTDGPTDAAGAFVDGTTLVRARNRGMDPMRYLDENNSYEFFATLGDLFVTGPTGTNVMDLQIAVLYP